MVERSNMTTATARLQPLAAGSLVRTEGALLVGELARRTGKTVRALHLYEEIGLLEPADRSKGGYRRYRSDAVTRVEWIARLQDAGLSLPDIRELLAGWNDGSNAPDAMLRLSTVYRQKLAETRTQIERLHALETELASQPRVPRDLQHVRARSHRARVLRVRSPRVSARSAADGRGRHRRFFREGHRKGSSMTLSLPIYMDNHATTPLDPRVLEAMMPYLTGIFGNAASRNHSVRLGSRGSRRRRLVSRSAKILIGAHREKEIIFTSGATESNNLAIKGIAESCTSERGNHIITARSPSTKPSSTPASASKSARATSITYLARRQADGLI